MKNCNFSSQLKFKRNVGVGHFLYTYLTQDVSRLKTKVLKPLTHFMHDLTAKSHMGRELINWMSGTSQLLIFVWLFCSSMQLLVITLHYYNYKSVLCLVCIIFVDVP
jgi:hypothetical protein